MPTPSEQLQRLRVVLEAGIPVPADVSAWLLEGIAVFETQDDPERVTPLCTILGLRPEGRRSVRYQRKLERRNRVLREALQHIPEELSDWQRCARLRDAINRMQMEPASTDPIIETLREADTDLPLPGSVNALLKATGSQ